MRRATLALTLLLTGCGSGGSAGKSDTIPAPQSAAKHADLRSVAKACGATLPAPAGAPAGLDAVIPVGSHVGPTEGRVTATWLARPLVKAVAEWKGVTGYEVEGGETEARDAELELRAEDGTVLALKFETEGSCDSLTSVRITRSQS